MIASLTRLRLRSWRYLPGFAWYAHGSRQSMRQAPGFLGGRLLADERLTFWTLSLWQDEDTLTRWRNAGQHGEAMSRLKHWCDEAGVARWPLPEGSRLPDWPGCHRRIVTEGRLTPVLKPSDTQRAGVAAIPVPTSRPSSVSIQPVTS